MSPHSEERLFDPICGMWLAPYQVGTTYTYIGRTYSFCSAECCELFARKPDVYVVRLAYDPEACIAHICPVQRDNSIDRSKPSIS
jgi:YHS domain-containing protein